MFWHYWLPTLTPPETFITKKGTSDDPLRFPSTQASTFSNFLSGITQSTKNNQWTSAQEALGMTGSSWKGFSFFRIPIYFVANGGPLEFSLWELIITFQNKNVPAPSHFDLKQVCIFSWKFTGKWSGRSSKGTWDIRYGKWKHGLPHSRMWLE